MDSPIVRLAEPRDVAQLASMCHLLWPDDSIEEHTHELLSVFNGPAPGNLPSIFLVAQQPGGEIVGFVEVGLRSHADGCDPSQPVGYLEGWYVKPEFRRKRVGARLIGAAEEWARDRGCTEMASDTWLDNPASQIAHEALGFEVVDRCVHYRKRL
jgi:aminoglycoside 6'-N-acetyltransferase I